MKKILFTGGGSAGHVVPNIALMDDLLTTGKAEVCYMGTDGIEKRLLSGKNIPYYTISCPKLIRGGGLAGLKNNLRIPWAFFKAVKNAQKGLELLRPDVVFSKGGYVALPVVFAAKRLRIPCYAHESDFSPGLANKLSASKCQKTFTSFPETAKRLRRGEYSGAPMRRSVLYASKADARSAMDIPPNRKTLLVFGGGSGSQVINDAVRAQLKKLTEKYLVLHVCGKGNLIESNAKNYRQFEYISGMGKAYACADVVVSRSGAGAVFELMCLKKPTLFIPLEGQTRGDQIENAEYFQKKGLCRILWQSSLSRLSECVDETFEDKALRQRLAASHITPANERIIRELLRP